MMSEMSDNPSDDLANTELFIDGKQGLLIQMGVKGTDQETF